MAVVQDTFTDTAGTLLTSHTGEVGATWTNHPVFEATIQITDVNRIRPSTASTANGCLAYASGVPSTADYSVSVVVVAKSLDDLAGVRGRHDTTANTCYEAIYNAVGISTQWRLAKRVAGAFTELGTFSQAISLDTAYTLKLEMIGTAIKLYVDDVERVSVTDGDVTAVGRAAVTFWGDDVTPSNTVGIHLDSLTADVAGVSRRQGLRAALMGVG